MGHCTLCCFSKIPLSFALYEELDMVMYSCLNVAALGSVSTLSKFLPFIQ